MSNQIVNFISHEIRYKKNEPKAFDVIFNGAAVGMLCGNKSIGWMFYRLIPDFSKGVSMKYESRPSIEKDSLAEAKRKIVWLFS